VNAEPVMGRKRSPKEMSSDIKRIGRESSRATTYYFAENGGKALVVPKDHAYEEQKSIEDTLSRLDLPPLPQSTGKNFEVWHSRLKTYLSLVDASYECYGHNNDPNDL